MNSKERVLAALNHEKPDRVPLDLGGWVTSMHKKAYENLVDYLKKETAEPNKYPDDYRLKDWVQQMPDIHESVLTRLGIDTRYIRPGTPKGEDWRLERREDEDYYYITDGWGVVRKTPKEDGLYYDIVFSRCPLKDASVEDLEEYDWPDPEDPGFVEGLKEKAREIKDRGYAVVADFNFESWYENCWYMRGFERFYKDLYVNPEFVRALLKKTSEVHMKFLEHTLTEVGDEIDVIMQGDDLANQDGPAMSVDMYREFVKPRQREIFDLIRRLTDAKLFYHCCGSVKELLPDLIDIGVEIINPVQVRAKDMDTEVLKEEFGDELSFWGAIDTQKTLPRGTPADVAAAVKTQIDNLNRDGGYVLTSVHNIQADVSPENILAAFETAKEYS